MTYNVEIHVSRSIDSCTHTNHLCQSLFFIRSLMRSILCARSSLGPCAEATRIWYPIAGNAAEKIGIDYYRYIAKSKDRDATNTTCN